jgi:hypothetical protein
VVRLCRRRERLLLRTHEPPFRLPAWAVGQVVEHESKLFRVTRWEELPALPLERGGSLKQWEVWGRRVSNSQIQREIVTAAEAILETKPPGES